MRERSRRVEARLPWDLPPRHLRGAQAPSTPTASTPSPSAATTSPKSSCASSRITWTRTTRRQWWRLRGCSSTEGLTQRHREDGKFSVALCLCVRLSSVSAPSRLKRRASPDSPEPRPKRQGAWAASRWLRRPGCLREGDPLALRTGRTGGALCRRNTDHGYVRF